MRDANETGDLPRYGRLVRPYPVERCCAADCQGELGSGAYAFRDLETDKLVVFCEDCATYVELNVSHRFMLLPL